MLKIVRLLIAIALGLAFARIGVLHFQDPEPFEAIVPEYLGWPRFWNYASGALEIVLGLGLAFPPTRRWSARLLVLLVIAMSLANLNMWLNDLPFRGTRLTTTGHVVRWIIQIALLAVLAWLGWSRPRSPSPS